MNKKDLRKKYKKLRAQISAEELENLSIDIANQTLQLPIWEKSNYHIFLPIEKQKEINTEFLLQILQGKDKNISIPKSNFIDNSLEHILLTDTTKLSINPWGIPEPTEGISIPENKIEVVFVPLLAFDLQGHRIGYGKGFYDRFLSLCPPETLKVGLSLFPAETEIEEVLPTDIRLDLCVTPLKTYHFKN